MEIFQNNQTRKEYFKTQIDRCNLKFDYCKVYREDVKKYRKLIKGDIANIICLGTRNGKEVKLFKLFDWFVKVQGVEINPRAENKNVWIGSFDEMPKEWEKKFDLIFSNSFDQSQDPYKTAKEWKRVLKPGGYLIICIAEEAEPCETDPIGLLTLEDIKELFGCKVIYYHFQGSKNGYTEIIIKKEL